MSKIFWNRILQEITMKTKTVVIFEIILIMFLCSCSDYKKNAYNNLNQVDANKSAWLPSFLLNNQEIKQQVFNVLECHDLDTNESWGYFSIKNNEYLFDLSCISDTKAFNNKKLNKRLRKIGYMNSSNETRMVENVNFLYYLFFDEEQNKFYFYGIYK